MPDHRVNRTFTLVNFLSGGVYHGISWRLHTQNIYQGPAKITFISPNQTKNESDAVTLICNATGKPQPTIRWTRNLPDESNVTFNITGEQDKGVYTCTADNGVGNPDRKDVHITVDNFHPVDTNLSTSLNGMTVVVNTSFNLICSARASPPAKYRLYRGQKSLLNTTVGQSSVLYTTNVTERISQVNYSCTPFNFYGDGPTQTVTVTVTVHFSPNITDISRDKTVNEGATVTLSCTADGNPTPTITWRRPNNTVVNTNTLTLTGISRQENGTYRCTANNGVGSRVTKDVLITVHYNPEKVILTKNTSSKVCTGITVKFTCTADANPPVNLYTLYENNKPGENMSRTGENTKQLTKEGQFFYLCEANNSVGASRSSDTNLIVDVPASVTISSDPMVIKEGDNVIFFCNVSGSLSSNVRWVKTPTDQMIDGASWSVEKISRNSTGEYTCVASNACGNFSNTTFVNVQYAPSITVHQCPSSVTESDNAILYCNASGNPTPNIAWIRASTGEVISLHERLFIGAIKRNETDSYECLAWNGIGQNSTASCAIDVPYPPEIIRPSNSVWEICTGESTNVECLANASPAARYAWKNSDGAVVSNDRYLRFNEKDDIIGGNYTCTAQNSLGSDSFTILVKVRRMQIALEVVVSNVEYQPDYDNLNSDIAKKFVDKFEKEVDSIYNNKPSYSRAKVTRLREGSVIVSFVLSFTTAVTTSEGIAELITDLNDGAIGSYKIAALTIIPSLAPETTPTVSRTVTPGTSTILPGKETATSSSGCNDNDVVLGTLGALIGLLVVIIILLVIFIFWQRKTGIGRKQRPYEAPLDEKEVYDNEIAMDDFTPTHARSTNQSPQQLTMPIPTYMELQETNRSEHTNPPNVKLHSSAHSAEYAPLHPKTRLWEVARVNVTIEKIIGKGAFGQIAKATAVDLPRKPGKTMVAVKMLKSNSPESDKKDLLSELEVMKTLKPHPHVVKLLGCVTEFEPLWVLIEYVPYGDLLGYLRKSRGLNDTYYKDPDVKPQTSLTSQQLMKFAWQIADGMSYLSSRKIIHRDLAARNVLVGEGERCKVTDFGMARDVQQENIYEKKTKGRLPVKWTAYESLLYGTYTTKSDVWSYGVVLYEIFTIGGSPYPRMDGKRIANALQSGYRMPKPQHVDDALYHIMMNCWQKEPEARPSFPALTKQLKEMEKQHKRLINMHIYDNELYGNLEDLNV